MHERGKRIGWVVYVKDKEGKYVTCLRVFIPRNLSKIAEARTGMEAVRYIMENGGWTIWGASSVVVEVVG